MSKYRLSYFIYQVWYLAIWLCNWGISQIRYNLSLCPLFRKSVKNGFSRYAVVTAAYNVEAYLDKYFSSLTKQLLDFKNNIRVIIVDDGSTDNSAAIIKSWQSRFPDNIILVSQKNAGQGAARNAGLALVTEPWVTFIDADDFIDPAYFLCVDNFLRRFAKKQEPGNAIKLLCCNFIFYFENWRRFRDTHPLRYRFLQKKEKTVDSNSPEAIHMAVNSAFFRHDIIRTYDLRLSEQRWPKFEDADFVLRYIHEGADGLIVYLRDARYYYRKRRAGDSSLDLAQYKKCTYLTLLQEAHLLLVEHFYSIKGYVPEAVQWTFLYDIMVYVRLLSKGFDIDSILSHAEQEELFSLILKVFAAIDDKVIMNSGQGIKEFDQIAKAGVLGCFKGQALPKHTVYAERHGDAPESIFFRVGTYEDQSFEIFGGGTRLEATLLESRQVKFLGHHYLYEKIYKLPRPQPHSMISVQVGEAPAEISCRGQAYSTPVPARKLLRASYVS